MFHLPIWITVASFLSLLAPLIRSIRPVVARELLLKYSIRLNKYEYRLDLPSQCPSNTDIFRSAAGVSRTMYDVDFERYQGEWLSLRRTTQQYQTEGFVYAIASLGRTTKRKGPSNRYWISNAAILEPFKWISTVKQM